MATYVEPETRDDEEETPRRRGWANPRFRFGLLAAVVIIAIAGLLLYIHYSGRESTDDAQVDGHVTPISSKVYGNVLSVLVNDNQQVKAGDVLVRIDPRDYEVRVDQAKAALALAENQSRAAQLGIPLTQETTASATSSAQAQVSVVQAEVARARHAYEQSATADLAFAQSNVASAEADAEKARADLERMRPLASKAEISQQQFDSFVQAARVAEARLKAAHDKYNSAQHDVQKSKAALEAAEARVRQAQAGVREAQAGAQRVPITRAQASSASSSVEQARANLAAAQLELSYTTIVAPVDGVITRKSVEPGQIIQPGQGLMVLIALKDVWITANFKETQLAHVRRGQPAEIHVDMYKRSFPGHVDSIAGATGSRLSLLPPENATGNFVKVVQRIPVKIVLDPINDPNYVLRPGMNVDATILLR